MPSIRAGISSESARFAPSASRWTASYIPSPNVSTTAVSSRREWYSVDEGRLAGLSITMKYGPAEMMPLATSASRPATIASETEWEARLPWKSKPASCFQNVIPSEPATSG